MIFFLFTLKDESKLVNLNKNNVFLVPLKILVIEIKNLFLKRLLNRKKIFFANYF
jgi:hypothetical protein